MTDEAPVPGGDVLSGHVVPGPDAPPPAPAWPPAPRRPGLAQAMWRHHGPFIRPFLWLPAVWLNAMAVLAVSPLPARAFLAAGRPPVSPGRSCAGRARARGCTWPCPSPPRQRGSWPPGS